MTKQLLLLFLLLATKAAAQKPPQGCFDAPAIAAACTPVYIRVNIHLFVADDGTGNVQQWANNQVAAFARAEALVAQANKHLADNPEQWPRQNPPRRVCVPIRYVLESVHQHCLSNADGRNKLAELQKNFGVGKDSVYNMYIADFPGSSNGQALHTYATIENGDISNFNHEIGHVLNLNHSHELNDGCDDTPSLRFDWDKNCDGKLSFDEKNLKCWELNEADPDTNVVRNDRNKNGRDDCRERSPCSPNPCCLWDWQHNNIMSHSAYQAAYTQCQVDRMLAHLDQVECRFVAQVGGECPPLRASIAQTAFDALGKESCVSCLILQSSVNEQAHSLEIYQGTQPWVGKPVSQRPWQEIPAQDFCFSTRFYSGVPFLKPNQTHVAVLIVRNACGVQDTAIFQFQTPDSKAQVTRRSGLSLEASMDAVQALRLQVTADKDVATRLVAIREDGHLVRNLPLVRLKAGQNDLSIHSRRKWPPGNYLVQLVSGTAIWSGWLSIGSF